MMILDNGMRRRCLWAAWSRRGILLGLVVSTCASAGDPPKNLGDVEGTIKVDGSSTVYPMVAVAAEVYGRQAPRVNVTIGISGTGGGFKKFLDAKPELRTDICTASRPITKEEIARAAEVGVEFIEVPFAIDGLAVMVHPSNTFCDHLTIEELKKIWEPNSKITNWKEVRQGFPDLPLKLFGPGTDSGTFDYFTEAVVGKAKASRSDYTASESDNTLVQGVEGEKGALGYFGFAYYQANKDKLKLLGIDNGNGQAIKPNENSIRNGGYAPLSRPLFLYVNKKAYERVEVVHFVEFMLDSAAAIIQHPRVKYVTVPVEMYEIDGWRLHFGLTGSLMDETHGLKDMLDVYRKNLEPAKKKWEETQKEKKGEKKE